MEWSNGVIFLIATFWPEGLCSAELSDSKYPRYHDQWHFHLPDDTVRALSYYVLDVILL